MQNKILLSVIFTFFLLGTSVYAITIVTPTVYTTVSNLVNQINILIANINSLLLPYGIIVSSVVFPAITTTTSSIITTSTTSTATCGGICPGTGFQIWLVESVQTDGTHYDMIVGRDHSGYTFINTPLILNSGTVVAVCQDITNSASSYKSGLKLWHDINVSGKLNTIPPLSFGTNSAGFQSNVDKLFSCVFTDSGVPIPSIKGTALGGFTSYLTSSDGI